MMDLLSSFHSYSIEHIKREQNNKADALSKLASMAFSKLAKEVLVEVIQSKSIEEKGVARKLRIKALLYKMIEEKLYQRSKVSGIKDNKVGILLALIKEAHYKQKLEGYYNKNVKSSTFKPGTYMLRLNSTSKAEYQGKMGSTWEGHYVIRKAYGDGAYKLETLSGEAVDRTWNGTNLCKFYV
ncbi:reverse transcriptase domain-containing protein [Tanacetum coccineum]